MILRDWIYRIVAFAVVTFSLQLIYHFWRGDGTELYDASTLPLHLEATLTCASCSVGKLKHRFGRHYSECVVNDLSQHVCGIDNHNGTAWRLLRCDATDEFAPDCHEHAIDVGAELRDLMLTAKRRDGVQRAPRFYIMLRSALLDARALIASMRSILAIFGAEKPRVDVLLMSDGDALDLPPPLTFDDCAEQTKLFGALNARVRRVTSASLFGNGGSTFRKLQTHLEQCGLDRRDGNRNQHRRWNGFECARHTTLDSELDALKVAAALGDGTVLHAGVVFRDAMPLDYSWLVASNDWDGRLSARIAHMVHHDVPGALVWPPRLWDTRLDWRPAHGNNLGDFSEDYDEDADGDAAVAGDEQWVDAGDLMECVSVFLRRHMRRASPLLTANAHRHASVWRSDRHWQHAFMSRHVEPERLPQHRNFSGAAHHLRLDTQPLDTLVDFAELLFTYPCGVPHRDAYAARVDDRDDMHDADDNRVLRGVLNTETDRLLRSARTRYALGVSAVRGNHVHSKKIEDPEKEWRMLVGSVVAMALQTASVRVSASGELLVPFVVATTPDAMSLRLRWCLARRYGIAVVERPLVHHANYDAAAQAHKLHFAAMHQYGWKRVIVIDTDITVVTPERLVALWRVPTSVALVGLVAGGRDVSGAFISYAPSPLFDELTSFYQSYVPDGHGIPEQFAYEPYLASALTNGTAGFMSPSCERVAIAYNSTERLFRAKKYKRNWKRAASTFDTIVVHHTGMPKVWTLSDGCRASVLESRVAAERESSDGKKHMRAVLADLYCANIGGAARTAAERWLPTSERFVVTATRDELHEIFDALQADREGNFFLEHV